MGVVSYEWDHLRLLKPVFVGVTDLISRIPDLKHRTSWPTCEELNHCFASPFSVVNVTLQTAHKQKPKRHMDGTLDVSSLYEVQIAQCGVIPTRPENLHDFLNALIWAAMPLSKYALTASVAAMQIERAQGRRALPVARSRAHDRLALVDEGGAIVFGSERQTFIFGHAILQHAYLGQPDVRCAIINVDATPLSRREQLDEALSRVLANQHTIAAALAPGAGAYVLIAEFV
jgi:hypothetical protein